MQSAPPINVLQLCLIKVSNAMGQSSRRKRIKIYHSSIPFFYLSKSYLKPKRQNLESIRESMNDNSKVKDVSIKFPSYGEGVFLNYPKIWVSESLGWS